MNLFWKKEDESENARLEHQISELLLFCSKQLSSRVRTTPLKDEVTHFNSLPVNERYLRLPGLILLFENYLLESDPTYQERATSFRDKVKANFVELCAEDHLEILFRDSPESEQILIVDFLLELMGKLYYKVGEASSNLDSIQTHLTRFRKQSYSLYDHQLIELDKPQFEHFKQLIRIVRKRMFDLLGVSADDMIRVQLKDYIEYYAAFTGVSLLIEILPVELLDEEMLRILNRNQMHEMLWRKIKELEKQQEVLQKESIEKTNANELLREQKLELNEMLENALDSVITMDSEGRVVFWNKRSEEIFGWEKYDILGKPLADFIIPEEYRQRHKASIKRYLETGESRILNKRMEITGLRKDGASFPVELSITPVVRAKKVVFNAFIRDLTKDKEAEEALIEARRSAEEANKAKSRFLANMSHEIRTPLNGVLGFAELLSGTDLNQEQKDQLEIIQNSGQSLLHLLSDILDFSRIEQDRMFIKPEKWNFKREMEKLVNSFRSSAQLKGLKLGLDIDSSLPEAFYLDMPRFNQVVSNLISNAIKFTQVGEVLVKVDCLGSDHDHYKIRTTVSDTGSGVDMSKMKNLFESFVQGEHKYTGVMEGVGLGLAISREIVYLMNGEIDYKSPSDQFQKRGSDFWFTVELKKARPVLPSKVEETIPQLEGFKVLLVEDNTVNRMLFARMLKDLNCEVSEAVDGEQALNMIVDGSYELVLMDVQMPKMDGLEVCRRVRQNGIETPIVAISANVYPEDVQNSLEAGMQAHLGKPIDRKDLINILSELRFRD